MKSALTTLLIFFSFFNLLFGQKGDIQLTEKSNYSTLKKKINNCKSDTICLSKNINVYINKAKKEKDTLNQIKGYRYYIQLERKTQYKDSIFKLLIGSKKKQFISELSIVYFVLGNVFYDKREYSNAITYYLKSKTISDNATEIVFNIALINSRLGNYEESLGVFQNTKNELKDKEYYTDYIISLYAISDAHRHLKQLDSAILYNNLGLKEVKSHNIQNLTPYFKLNEACINHDNFAYGKSYDSLQKIIPQFISKKDLSNLAMCYYFMGMSAKQLNHTKDFVNSMKKLDSITHIINDLEPEFRNGYEALINHFHKKDDVTNELKYVKRLLEIDNVINKRYKNLTKRISKGYNTPILLKERKRLILSFQKEKKLYFYFISFSTLVILLLLI